MKTQSADSKQCCHKAGTQPQRKSGRHSWSKTDIWILKMFYPVETVTQVAARLERTNTSTTKKARALGLASGNTMRARQERARIPMPPPKYDPVKRLAVCGAWSIASE
jgi:hypothetical protein